MIPASIEAAHHFSSTQVPRQVLAISPVSSNPGPGARGFSLPLNIIALIVSFVRIDDVSDIARVTRTCRLMYYMTIPQLYEKVALRSYPELRYVEGRPEGFGAGSPFCMALSGLATNNTSTLVKDFRVCGTWPEPRREDYHKGLVPDSTMLLGISLRAVIDKMANITTFSWELDTKPLKTLYCGLATRPLLTSLTLVFSSDRAPRPIVTIPPIPNLRRLRISNVDPLCYPDDISVLLLGSKKLEDLRISWSPRMRESAEPSTDLRTYFGKCLEAKYKMPLKHWGMQNFYGTNTGDLARVGNPDTIRSSDFINTFGGTKHGLATAFIDETWKNIPDGTFFKNMKKQRLNEPTTHHAKILASFSGLEEFYLVNAQPDPLVLDASSRSTTEGAVSPTTIKTPASSFSSPGKCTDHTNSALCKEYLNAVTSRHGSTMKKLLLSTQWPLNGQQISSIVSSCPNLEQLGLALSTEEGGALRILAPFLTKLRAIRILDNPWLQAALKDDQELIDALRMGPDEVLHWQMSPTTQVQWVGLGDAIFKIGKVVQKPDEDGTMVWMREATRASLDDVKDVDIWGLDVLEI